MKIAKHMNKASQLARFEDKSSDAISIKSA